MDDQPNRREARTPGRPMIVGETLPAAWAHHARTRRDAIAVSHWSDGAIVHRYTWGTLFDDARCAAAWLRALGVKPGQVCALLLPPSPQFFAIYMGVMLTGALPSVIAYPNERLHPQKFRDGLAGMAARSGLDWLFTERTLWQGFADLLENTAVHVAMVDDAWRVARPLDVALIPAPDHEAPCLLQHSSGTTGLQKGVALSHHAIIAHAKRYGDAIRIVADDSIATWLPLYHDMGLIAAFHIPLLYGIPIVQLDAFAWVVRPAELLSAIAAERATLTWLPNFAFNLLADRVRSGDVPAGACESLRLVISCSEPVRQSSIDRLAEKFAPFGLERRNIGASFAMAETTFAITQTPLGAPPRVDRVSRAAIGVGVARVPAEGEGVRECVSSGRPIEGCAVRIVNGAGTRLGDAQVGSIEVTSVSLFSGYSHNEAAGAGVLRDGWFITGDIGYVRDDELFVIGREKDLIIVAGKNIYPEDVEDAVAGVEGVTKGRVVAFEVDDEQRGTGQIGVVVETDESLHERLLILRSQVARIGNDFDVPINHIFFAKPRWLIKSSSGKLSRRDNGIRAQAELEDPIWTTT
jgi:fatty-acyl-CoA synthase